ncbi:MAG TPA: glycosyltransferase family 4 protein [Methylotenera sp.]|nr:glycosyltransferase family 4 protein [Methylotenera sp.]
MTYLPILFGYHASNLGNSHVPLSLCRFWQEGGRKVKLIVASAEKNISYPWLQPAMTGLKKSLVYKLKIKDKPRYLAENEFFKTEMSAPVVYLWAGLSVDIFEQFHKNGAKIVIERINCHRATSRRVLKNAEDIWGVQPKNQITDEDIAGENRKLEIADAIFCPSPMVKNSMLENGVPSEKLLSTSYGWEPERFKSTSLIRHKNLKPVFLFVGTLCLRKGVPLLLEAWKRADIDGELLLCGAVDEDIQSGFAEQLKGKNVRHITYTKNIGKIYRQADVFVFPSLEEGGPMVTYEAMAHGIPPLVTAMGAGAIVENGINGVVLPDMDIDAWATAIKDIAENKERRAALGENARIRAQEFTWQKVAEQRAKLLEDRYPQLWNGCR